MPKGLALPIKVNSSGGSLLIEGSDNDNKIVLLALGETENENAFQQGIGLGASMIFRINDSGLRGIVIAKVREIFNKFKRELRYELVENSLRWIDSSSGEVEQGEAVLELRYLSKEANELRLLQVPFSSSHQGSGQSK